MRIFLGSKGSKIFLCVVLLSLSIAAAPQTVNTENSDTIEVSGTILQIDNTQIILETDQKQIHLFAKDTGTIRVGNFVRVLCRPATDAPNVFLVEEIEVLEE